MFNIDAYHHRRSAIVQLCEDRVRLMSFDGVPLRWRQYHGSASRDHAKKQAQLWEEKFEVYLDCRTRFELSGDNWKFPF